MKSSVVPGDPFSASSFTKPEVIAKDRVVDRHCVKSCVWWPQQAKIFLGTCDVN